MERVDKTDKSFQFFFGAGCGSKTIIYVAAKKFWFGTVELIKNLFFLQVATRLATYPRSLCTIIRNHSTSLLRPYPTPNMLQRNNSKVRTVFVSLTIVFSRASPF